MFYMIKVAIYLAGFYLVYSVFLSRDTSYVRNRFFIICSFILALLLPLINFQTTRPMNIQLFGRLLSDVIVTTSGKGSDTSSSSSLASFLLRLIYPIYFTVVILFVIKLLADLVNLFYLIIRKREPQSRIITFHGFNTAGFSAMGYVFINSKLSSEEAAEIIRHEQNHLEQKHFLDILFIDLVKAFQWFNPVVYLFDRSLRAIHEYEADKSCLNSGISVVNYQCLLLNQVFKSRAFNLTNSFSNPSLVKKRMIMMTKKRTSAFASTKLLLAIPVTLLVFLAISAYREIPASPVKQIVPVTSPKTSLNTVSSNTSTIQPDAGSDYEPSIQSPPPPPVATAKTIEAPTAINEVASEENRTTPYVVVEEMPMFPGGDAELLKFIGENTRYPEDAKLSNVQGRVIIRFCITAEGGVSMVSVLKGVSPSLDAEAIRVVQTLPEFKPGRQGGVTVPVWYMVPITFTLK
jgi:TonB family protein